MKPTERFTNRVENYHRYRPTYSEEFLSDIQQTGAIPAKSKIAEIGSGTGILTKQLLEAGWQVIGIEPNQAMREMAEKQRNQQPAFRSIQGTAEATTLEAKSVETIIAAQAFHWFDTEAARKEFLRILKPEGKVVLVWNIRQHSTEFLKSYEDFLHHYSTDYSLVDHQQFDWKGVAHFFRNHFQRKEAANPQMMGWPKLWGYYQSCSYALPHTHNQYNESKEALKMTFDKHAYDGLVSMLYHTIWYIGSLD